MTAVAGTAGYGAAVARFAAATEAVSFEAVNADFLPWLRPGAICLDVGAGTGRDAAALAARGHRVTGVEPLQEFLCVARARSAQVDWVRDALPALAGLAGREGSYGFVLALGVWHHLAPADRAAGFSALARLAAPGAVLAMTLRHGPHGVGTHAFPCDSAEEERTAARAGFALRFRRDNCPSLLPGKADVTWTRMVFENGRCRE